MSDNQKNPDTDQTFLLLRSNFGRTLFLTPAMTLMDVMKNITKLGINDDKR